MSEKELLLINHYASIPVYPGPTRNYDLAAALVSQGWKVTLFSCKFNHYLRAYLKDLCSELNGVQLRWLWSTPYQGNSLARELNIICFSWLSFWQGLFTPARVVIAVTPPLESAFMGWLLARVKRVPFVLDLEDLWPDSIISMGFKNRLVIGWLRFLEHFLYRHADHLLVVAAEMGEYLLKQGVAPEKISLIPLGANLPDNLLQREQVRAAYGWQDDEVVAVYVGAHGPANALETLIQTALELANIPKLRLVLFGDGSDKPRLKELLANLNLQNIQLEAPVAPEAVPSILQAAEIGIASLKKVETFKTVRPNKLYEYMAVGLPIVCAIEGEAARFVTEINSGLAVTPEDPVALAAALKELAAAPELRETLGENGREYVQREGDRVKLAAELGRVLERVMGESEAGYLNA